MALPKMLKKKNWFGNCGNAIAENEKKKFVLSIVAMALLKMEKKKKKGCSEICEKVKKKLLRTQYFYNILTINHTWLVIIS